MRSASTSPGCRRHYGGIAGAILLDVWRWTSFIFIIVLAGLSGIPSDLYDAAVLDAKSHWQVMWHLAIPLAWPVITIAVLLRTIECLKVFAIPFALTSGGPGTSTQTFSAMDYLTTIQFFDFGKGSAMGIVFLIMVSVVITCSSSRCARRWRKGGSGTAMVNILWTRAERLVPRLHLLSPVRRAVFTLMPFLWAAVNSVKTLTETFQLGAFIPFLQFQPTLDSWREVLADPQTENAFISSCVVSAGTTIFSLILGVPAAYALARYEFPVKSNDIALWFLSQRVLPPAVVLVALLSSPRLSAPDRHLDRASFSATRPSISPSSS